jgi:PAS domain S-box-containing protein
MAENPIVSNYNLLLGLSGLIASTDNFNALLDSLIQKVCDATGCSMAEAWFYQSSMKTLVLHDIYVPDQEKDVIAPFYDCTRRNNYMKGKGLPDYVLEKGMAEWAEDVYDKPYFFRREYARKSGIHTAFAIPVSSDGQVKVVMCFYRRSFDKEDVHLMQVLTTVAGLVSRAFTSDRLINQLNETELRFWNIFNSAPDSLVIADQRGVIILANPATEAMFMYRPDELSGKSLQVLMPEGYREAHQQGLERYTATGEMRVINHTLELEGLRKDGSIFPLELSIATWKHNGERYYSGIIRDRTQSMKDKARLQSKIHDLDTIIYRLSHDLRGPVTTMKGIAYHAQQDVQDIEALNYFGLVLQSSETLDRKLKELNIIAGISQDGLKYEHEDLKSLVFNITNHIKSLEEAAGVEFRMNIQPDRPVVIDKKLLYYVLDKLINNAVKYRRYSGCDYVNINAGIHGDQLVFSIEDNGCGIEGNQLDKVFDLFYRANDATSGTGLGLFIVKQALEKLNGYINIESTSGKGTIVRLAVPLPSIN